MSKVDPDHVKLALKRLPEGTVITQEVIDKIVQELKEAAKLESAAVETRPQMKKSWVLVVCDPEGVLAGKDLVGWPVQIPEEEALDTAVMKIHQAAWVHNATTRKGKSMPIRTVGEACEFVSSDIFKEQKIWIRSIEPVLVVGCPSEIPSNPNSSF